MARADRRGSERAQVEWRVVVEPAGGEPLSGRAVDVGARGLRVALAAAVPVGTAVTVRVTAIRRDGAENVFVRSGRIVHATGGLVGIELTDAAPGWRVPMAASPEARRRAPRARVGMDMTLEAAGAPHPCHVVDLSAVGARIETAAPLRPGETVVLLITRPSKADLAVPGTVHELTDRGAVLTFDVPQDVRDKLDAYVEGLMG